MNENISASNSEALDRAFESTGYESKTDENLDLVEDVVEGIHAFRKESNERAEKARKKFDAATESNNPVLREEREADRQRFEAIDKAVSRFEVEALFDVGAEDTGQLVEELEDLHYDKAPLDLAKEMLDWHFGFLRDRDGTAEKMLRLDLASPTLEGPKKKRPTDEIGKALLKVDRRESWAPAVEFIRQHGLDPDTFLRAGIHWTKERRSDPVGANAKLRALYDAPITESHAQEQAAQHEYNLQAEHLRQELAPVLNTQAMPLIENESIQRRVAEILESSQIDAATPGERLWIAYHLASNEYAQAKMAEDREAVRGKARLSITGSGHAGSASGHQSKTINEALDRAFASVGA